jgi:hypothetical protein
MLLILSAFSVAEVMIGNWLVCLTHFCIGWWSHAWGGLIEVYLRFCCANDPAFPKVCDLCREWTVFNWSICKKHTFPTLQQQLPEENVSNFSRSLSVVLMQMRWRRNCHPCSLIIKD